LGAVAGPFFVTAGGIFGVYMITDEDNPKNELKNLKSSGKNAWPLHFHGHDFRISGKTRLFNPYKAGDFGSQFFFRAQGR
jgi:hypothetical protein